MPVAFYLDKGEVRNYQLTVDQPNQEIVVLITNQDGSSNVTMTDQGNSDLHWDAARNK